MKAYVREVPLEAALLMAAQASGAGSLASAWVPRGLDLADLLAGRAGAPGEVAASTTTDAPRWAPTVAAAAEPLAIERTLAAAPPPVSVPDWIVNRHRKDGQWVLHLAAYPLEGLPEDAKLTRCGWRFGNLPGVVLTPAQPAPEEYKRVCKRCAPAIRLQLRGAVVARVVTVASPDQ